jgi:hypothetical protein
LNFSRVDNARGDHKERGTYRDCLDLAVRKLVLARRSLERVPCVDVRVLVHLNQPDIESRISAGESANDSGTGFAWKRGGKDEQEDVCRNAALDERLELAELRQVGDRTLPAVRTCPVSIFLSVSAAKEHSRSRCDETLVAGEDGPGDRLHLGQALEEVEERVLELLLGGRQVELGFWRRLDLGRDRHERERESALTVRGRSRRDDHDGRESRRILRT